MKQFSGKSGMTLVEVLVASAILAGTLAAGITVFVQNRAAVCMIEKSVDAMHTARGQMELLRSLSYHNEALSSGVHTYDGGVYTVTGSVDLKDIEVTAYWYDNYRHVTGRVSLVTTLCSDMHP